MTLITNSMKAFLGKLLFVLAIVGIIAVGNILFPNPQNDVLPPSEESSADSLPQEPSPE